MPCAFLVDVGIGVSGYDFGTGARIGADHLVVLGGIRIGGQAQHVKQIQLGLTEVDLHILLQRNVHSSLRLRAATAHQYIGIAHQAQAVVARQNLRVLGAENRVAIVTTLLANVHKALALIIRGSTEGERAVEATGGCFRLCDHIFAAARALERRLAKETVDRRAPLHIQVGMVRNIVFRISVAQVRQGFRAHKGMRLNVVLAAGIRQHIHIARSGDESGTVFEVDLHRTHQRVLGQQIVLGEQAVFIRIRSRMQGRVGIRLHMQFACGFDRARDIDGNGLLEVIFRVRVGLGGDREYRIAAGLLLRGEVVLRRDIDLRPFLRGAHGRAFAHVGIGVQISVRHHGGFVDLQAGDPGDGLHSGFRLAGVFGQNSHAVMTHQRGSVSLAATTDTRPHRLLLGRCAQEGLHVRHGTVDQ